MPILDVVGGTGVGDIRMDARIHTHVSEADACSHDPIFEGFSLVVPLVAAVGDTSFHG
jgi:hypothetical protein